MEIDGKGPSETCCKLMSEFSSLSAQTNIFAIRQKKDYPNVKIKTVIPNFLNILPTRFFRKRLVNICAHSTLKNLSDQSIAYIWPSTPNDIVFRLKEFGVKIICENINTHTAFARELIEFECERIGAPPQHRITDKDIEYEKIRHSLANYIFCPNKFVESSLIENGVENGKLIATSYGSYVVRNHAREIHKKDIKFLSVGTACVRKGFHNLVEAWKMARVSGKLFIAGNVEKYIAERYRDFLNRPDVTVLGYKDNIFEIYRNMDVFVFPTLEEGGPQVTYEAAACGLPIITTEMGAGRIAKDGRNALLVDGRDEQAFAETIQRIARDCDLRAHLGENALVDSGEFTWGKVADRRLAKLAERIGI